MRRRFVALLLAAVGCTPASSDLVLVGTVERTLVELVAPVSEVLVEIAVERGQSVEAQQTIAQLDATLALAAVRQAEAGLAAAQTASVVANHDLERARELRRGGVASEQALERAELTRAEAVARWRAAEAGLSSALKRHADLTLRAPARGVVDQIPFDEGERVPAGAVLAVLLQDRAPWVRVWIPERAFARVGPGTRARIEIDGLGRALGGRVVDIAREPEFTPHFALTERDRAHLVYETRVGIDEPPARLRPGAPATVTLLLEATAEDQKGTPPS